MKIARKRIWRFEVTDGNMQGTYHTDKEEYLDDALNAIGHIIVRGRDFNLSKRILITIDSDVREDDDLEMIEW